jgi:hypothetical protein
VFIVQDFAVLVLATSTLQIEGFKTTLLFKSSRFNNTFEQHHDTHDQGPRGENVLGNFHMVVVNSLKTMIKRNPYHVLKALVTTHSVKHTS